MMNRTFSQTDRWEEMIGRSFEPRQWFEDEGFPAHPSDYEQQEGRIRWVYRKLTNSLTQLTSYAVGFYSPDREWHQDSTFNNAQDATNRVHYLNGGSREQSSQS